MSELRDACRDMVDAACAEGADDVVAQAFRTATHQVRFSSSQIDAVNWWEEEHAVLFVAIGKRTMASDIRDLDDPKLSARELVALARSVPPTAGYGGIASGRFKYRRPSVDGAIAKAKDPSRHVHEAIRAAEKEGAIDVGGTLFVRIESRAVESTGGASADDRSAAMDLSVRAFSQPEASGHAVSCVTRLSKLRAGPTGERAGRLAMMARDPVQGEEGRTDLVLEPLFIGGLIEPTSDMLSAARVEIGTSMYAKRLGKKVASTMVTLADDPTVESMSMRTFDHEGVPTRRTVLIKDGVLKTYLHGTSTAKRFRTRSTSNAGPMVPERFKIAMQPVPFHPVLRPGKWSLEEMVEDTQHGLYLNHTWYTRFQDYSTGDFSTIPRDAILRIEGGEVVGAVKNVRVSDNLMALWKSVDALSKETEEIFWWDDAAPPSTLPCTRARNVMITRSS